MEEKQKQLKEVKVMTSQVKKGDRFSRGNYNAVAESDAYINPRTGCWSVDIYKDLIYGWRSQDTEITVHRSK